MNLYAKDLEERINLPLFLDLVFYITDESNNMDASTITNEWLKNSIYPFNNYKINKLFSHEHNISYIGEFLVYYEDKGYTSISDFRAIALALAHTKELHHTNMFHDTQLDDFLKSISNKLTADFDIYLAVALYKLTSNLKAKDIILKSIGEATYTNATDCIFSLMLFNTKEETAELLMIMLFKINTFFCFPNELDIENNIYVYNFIFNTYQNSRDIKNYRGGSALQLLSELGEKRAHINTVLYSKLHQLEYSDKLIKYLNCILPVIQQNKRTLDLNKLSYVKNVIDYCQCLLKSDKELSETEKQYLLDLLWTHRSLAKKVNGLDSLLDVLLTNNEITMDETYKWIVDYLYSHNIIAKHIYTNALFIDFYDNKQVNRVHYLKENEQFIICTRYIASKLDELKNNTEQVKDILDIFNTTTDISYLDLYKSDTIDHLELYDVTDTISDCLNNIFLLLIEAEQINIMSYIEEIGNDINYKLKKFIFYFLRYGNVKKVIDFLQTFDNKFDIYNLKNLLGYSLYNTETSYSYSYSRDTAIFNDSKENNFLIKENFNNNEKRELINLISKSLFYNDSKLYICFIVNLILDDNITNLYEKNLLKSIYNKIITIDNYYIKRYLDELHKKFLSEDEYELLITENEKKKEIEKQEAAQEHDELVLSRIFDDLGETDDQILFLCDLIKYKYSYQFNDVNKKYQFLNKTTDAIVEDYIKCEAIDTLEKDLSNILQIKMYLYTSDYITFSEYTAFTEYLNKIISSEESAEYEC